MSGSDTSRGINFQYAYSISLLLQFLQQPVWDSIMFEGPKDIEDVVIYDAHKKVVLRAQIKQKMDPNQWKPSELKAILSKFANFQDSDAATYQFVYAGSEGKDFNGIRKLLEKVHAEGYQALTPSEESALTQSLPGLAGFLQQVGQRLDLVKRETWQGIRAHDLNNLHTLLTQNGRRPLAQSVVENVYNNLFTSIAEKTEAASPYQRDLKRAEVLALLRVDETMLSFALPPPRHPPLPPEPWADRPELASICDSLQKGGLSVLVVAEGRAGIGKTSLARKIAHDPTILKVFPDGVLWVELGMQPDVLGELARLASYFQVDVSHYSQKEDRADAVQHILTGRSCLLILEDAWDTEIVRIFQGLAPKAALLTTRDHNVSRAFAPPQNRTTLTELSLDASTKLLQELVPDADNPSDLHRLASIAAGLPLMIELLVPLLEDEIRMGWGLQTFLIQIESPTWRGEKLEAIIRKSLQRLPAEVRTSFAQLVVFGSAPATFNRAAAAAVWEVTEAEAGARLLMLVNRYLVDADGNGRFSLHQSVADVIIADHLDKSTTTRHAKYYLSLVGSNPEDWRTITTELPQIRLAWDSIQDNTDLTLALVWIMGLFHRRQGLQSEAKAWAQRGLELALETKREQVIVLMLNHMAALLYTSGNINHALGYTNLALEITDKNHDYTSLTVALSNIASSQLLVGHFQEALKQFEGLLEVAKKFDDEELQARCLTNVGAACYELKLWARAQAAYTQALAIWKHLGGPEPISEARALEGLGQVYDELGKTQQSLIYYVQALTLAEEQGDRILEAAVLNNMGLVYRKIGELERSLELHHKASVIWRDAGNFRDLAVAHNNSGLVYEALGNWESALKCYDHALSIQNGGDDPIGLGLTLYNKAAIHIHLFQFTEAERLMTRVVKIHEEINHPDLAQDRTILMDIQATITEQRAKHLKTRKQKRNSK